MARAGRIVINLVAGTTEYISGVDAAVSANKRLAQSANEVKEKLQDMGTHGVSGVQATSAALRTLEGGITNNLRAGERFLAQTLGLGEALKAAFPVFGAVALGGVLVQLGEHVAKLHDDFQKLQEAPGRIAAEGSKLVGTLQLQNAELNVSNDRLEQQIAKLQHKPQNGLKTALDDAIASSMRLSQALQKNNEQLTALLKQQNVSRWDSFFSSFTAHPQASTTGLLEQFGGKDGHGGYQAQFDKIDSDKTNDIAVVQEKINGLSPNDPRVEQFKQQIKEITDAANRSAQELRDNLLKTVIEPRLRVLQGEQQSYELRQRGDAIGASAAYHEVHPEMPEGGEVIAGAIPRDQSALINALTNIRNAYISQDALQSAMTTQGKDQGILANTKADTQPKQVDPLAEALDRLNVKVAALKAQFQASVASSDPLWAAYHRGVTQATEEIQRLNDERKKLKAPLPPLNTDQAYTVTSKNVDAAILQEQINQAPEYAKKKEDMVAADLRLSEELAQENQKLQQNLALIREHTAALQAQGSAVFSGGINAERQAKLNDFENQAAAGKMSPEEAAAKKEELQAQYDLQDLQAAFNRTHDDTLEKLQNELAILQKQAAAYGETADLAAAILSTQKAIEKIQDQQLLAVGDAKDGWDVFWRDLQQNTKSAAQDMHDILGGAVTSLNDELARAITGQKTSWSKFFFGLADQFAKAGLQMGEAKLAGVAGLGFPGSGGVLGTGVGARGASSPADNSLGGILRQVLGIALPKVPPIGSGASVGGVFSGETSQDAANLAGFSNSELGQLSGAGSGAPDGSLMAPLYVQFAGSSMSSGDSSVLSSLFKSLSGSSGSLISGLFSLLPHFAAGGDPSGPSVVGEDGPELFVPHAAGTIIPNNRMASGQNVTYMVDARGSTNSAETELRVRRGIREAHQQGASDGARLSREARARVPRSKASST